MQPMHNKEIARCCFVDLVLALKCHDPVTMQRQLFYYHDVSDDVIYFQATPPCGQPLQIPFICLSVFAVSHLVLYLLKQSDISILLSGICQVVIRQPLELRSCVDSKAESFYYVNYGSSIIMSKVLQILQCTEQTCMHVY